MTVSTDMLLGNQAFLEKIDKLRELNVGAIVPLPQLVVVGDQSSGKSSVLESVTGFSFPRATGLCTRYATQITCAREDHQRVSISIIPRPDAETALKDRLHAFRRELNHLGEEDLQRVFEEANEAMGIRKQTTDGPTTGLSAFSQDILKIEISGPREVHLTVIDVPGIFRVATPGLTSESDVSLVRNLVQRYMENRRTIILAVIPCNVDIATQEILKLAEKFDPTGVRTMGVLTKPDLATERATQESLIELVQGKRNPLRLGYYIVKNRSADDNESTTAQRLAAEESFFMAPAWSSVASRCGVPLLKARLQELLMEISKLELPNVKHDIDKRVNERSLELEDMGESRSDEDTQRQYLIKLASRMQDITKSALNGYYTGEPLFQKHPSLKLITKMVKLNEDFANIFWKRGHYQHFGCNWDDDGENTLGDGTSEMPFDLPGHVKERLGEIIEPDFNCPKPLKGPMIAVIENIYESSRGPELGTFNGTVLAAAFEIASQKWEKIVLSHISRAIKLVHGYIFRLLEEVCPDSVVREVLWNLLLEDELHDRYKSAMAHARFLLEVERSSLPTTYNHYFNAIMQTKRQDRLVNFLKGVAVTLPHYGDQKYVPINQIGKHAAENMDNKEQVCEDILDTLESYYKVARKRFVDTVCQQVVNHQLLTGPKSPLRILSAARISALKSEQLEEIAGEDLVSQGRRRILKQELESLRKAVKVLRS